MIIREENFKQVVEDGVTKLVTGERADAPACEIELSQFWWPTWGRAVIWRGKSYKVQGLTGSLGGHLPGGESIC